MDWEHGVFAGASMASETTAAASGQVGQVRRDPMAMKPFCGYNFADYWAHWLSFSKKSDKLPKVFHVNWFRKNEAGEFLWPGFGENMRVLEWIVNRCDGAIDAEETPIGYVPKPDSLNLTGLDIDPETMQSLLGITPSVWVKEINEIEEYFNTFGEKVPTVLHDQVKRVRQAVTADV
jgi:phosphoenolpyruvate carboxykinase (GTP)